MRSFDREWTVFRTVFDSQAGKNVRWILYVHCLLVLSIQWIFRNRELDLLCMPMHRIGSFHFSLTCYSHPYINTYIDF